MNRRFKRIYSGWLLQIVIRWVRLTTGNLKTTKVDMTSVVKKNQRSLVCMGRMNELNGLISYCLPFGRVLRMHRSKIALTFVRSCQVNFRIDQHGSELSTFGKDIWHEARKNPGLHQTEVELPSDGSRNACVPVLLILFVLFENTDAASLRWVAWFWQP